MLVSMTGFGRGEYTADGLRVVVEVKSVNSRFADISIRLPQSLRHAEGTFRDIVTRNIERGKLNITVEIERQDEAELDIAVNPSVVKSYRSLLERLKQSAGVDDPLSLNHFLQFDDVFTSKEEDESEIAAKVDAVSNALGKALKNLSEMREQEGRHLSGDLASRLVTMEELLGTVKKQAETRVPDARTRLQERIKTLLGDDGFDPERLEQEIALLADRIDITEEIVRLESHIKFFREAMDKEGAVGRRLNFLSQEMNREINTIGSKANDATISHVVVEMKDILEKIREQIQNIE